MTTVEQKIVQVISRTVFEDDPRKVVYRVRSSRFADVTYETTLFAGNATACTCPSWLPCFHKEQLEEREAAYAERDRIIAEFVLSQAEKATAVIEATDDSSSGSDSDPWEGLDDDQKWVAWRNYELGMMGLGL